MQQINSYMRAISVKAVLVDDANVVNSTKASITRGMQAELILHLFHGETVESAYTAADFANIASWIWYADSDYDQTTTAKLIVSEDIEVDEDGCIHIPITETNTTEIISYLGTAESKDLKCELAGFEAGNTKPVFILQWEFTIRNRIGNEGGGQPVPVGDSTYTKAQVDALIAASNTVEYSVDGSSWSSTCPAGATQRRYKNSAVSGAVWNVEALVKGADGSNGSNGQDGEDGETIYAYIGYASNSAGSNFSLHPTNDLKYRAEIHTSSTYTSEAGPEYIVDSDAITYSRYSSGDITVEVEDSSYQLNAWSSAAVSVFTYPYPPASGSGIYDSEGTQIGTVSSYVSSAGAERPNLQDFISAGAVFVKYIGDPGTGDMSTVDYVSEGGSGVVLSAGKANAVPWSGITGKPSSYTPESHGHAVSEITDGARQTVFRNSAAAELYLDKQIIQRTNVISNGVLTIDFSAIKASSGGTSHAGSAGDVFTWEYWCLANTDIVSLNLGSSMTISALETNPLPEELTMRGSNSTLHAFAVRAFYKSGAVQNMKITVNYLYSTEA